jgi:hypothetical protein
MTTKLPIRDVARAVVFVRANENSRSTEGASFSRAADTRHIPRLRSQLKCRWRIDPITGTLLAHWVDPSADRGADASLDDIIDARLCRRLPLRVARSPATTRAAA